MTTEESWKEERASAVALLRKFCTARGDNDWPDELHLCDILEKHLWCHLEFAEPDGE